MSNSISKAPYSGLDHCIVCGYWGKLGMLRYVVDAEEFLASQGLSHPVIPVQSGHNRQIMSGSRHDRSSGSI